MEVVRNRWRIRRARAGDDATVSALLDEAQALHARLQPGFFRAPRGERRHVDIDSLALLAEEAGEVGGVIIVRVVEAPRASFVTPARRLLVEDLAVRPDRRRLGCARILLDAARAHARSVGATQLVLTLWDGNPAAERLYAAMGFRRLSQVLGLDV
jgi:GNAT superfamily N-acetyltransferase